MLPDQLEWLAKMAGFAFVQVDDDGALRSNDLGQQMLGQATSFEDAIARVTRVNGGIPGSSRSSVPSRPRAAAVVTWANSG